MHSDFVFEILVIKKKKMKIDTVSLEQESFYEI